MNTAPGAGHPVTDPVGVGASPSHSQRPTGAVAFMIKCPPSLNVQRKYGIGQRKRFRDNLAMEMLACCPKRVDAHERLLLMTEKTKRVVKFTRFWGGTVKELDRDDNLPGACKPVLDELKLVTWKRRVYGAMVERPGLGLIFDDGPAYCTTVYDQVKDKSRAGQLLIEIS